MELIKLESLTKAEILSKAQEVINKIADGQADGLKVHLQAKAYIQYYQAIADQSQGYAIDEAEKYGKEGKLLGVGFRIGSTGERYDYEEDPIYYDLKAKLKAREELLKTAVKMRESIFDDETGEVVPKVSLKAAAKSTLTVTIK